MDVVIYHGTKKERQEIRQKYMPKTIGPKFPIVVTSYEIAMNDSRTLSHYNWKYAVVDEVTIILNCKFTFSFSFLVFPHSTEALSSCCYNLMLRISYQNLYFSRDTGSKILIASC